MTDTSMWSYRGGDDWSSMNLTGYTVEATDGDIGKVDEASTEVGANYIVVDTGPWIFGKKVMLPAGVISSVDTSDERVRVDRSKDEIKASPEFDETSYRDPAYREDLGGYYGERSTGL
ncbi:hypothetical protein N798_11545 [Knoellia flava TL1]|uniref:PRC-barrel domain containing protein n=2 Tax=Knoellia flava TaxID=913969 RepID=A0A8H9KPT8_9MICO|nr:PRC-barrel domain-containing protein [Knoellia flava]KGN30121.1 hypothetical protein N798_11545 [Knoellia flava TL1]GGB72706.1 hypothetical protein GCM10011314_10240 [Knoellia flava]